MIKYVLGLIIISLLTGCGAQRKDMPIKNDKHSRIELIILDRY